MKKLILILALFLHNTRKTEVSVDFLETNHVYNDKGDYIFTQIIAWNFCAEDGKPHNFGWRISNSPLDRPTKQNGIWFANGDKVTIISRCHVERWLNFDIEREDTRKWWDEDPPNVFKQ
jgi:hypothetical protein